MELPHLVAPVIVDTDEVLIVLRAIQNEMLHRYKLMEGIGVRNIEGYNKKASEHIPYLMIIIDELADLMMAAAYEVEQGLVRLAQLGRATGIHLILATQRPSVNVVTGLVEGQHTRQDSLCRRLSGGLAGNPGLGGSGEAAGQRRHALAGTRFPEAEAGPGDLCRRPGDREARGVLAHPVGSAPGRDTPG